MTPDQSPLPNEVKNVQVESAQSPNINKDVIEIDVELLDFPAAIKKAAEGEKISKKEWSNVNVYAYIKEDKLMLHKEDGIDYAWFITTGDLAGIDWIIVK